MTLRRALIWALESPRRLAAISMIAVATVIAGPFALTQLDHDAHPTSTQALVQRHTSPSNSTASPAPRTERITRGDRSRAVAERFLKAYVRKPGGHGSKERRDLRRVSTDDLWRGLRSTSHDRLPTGPIDSLDRTVGGTYLNQYRARLADGSSLVLHVVASGEGWLVSDVQAGGEP